MANLKWLEQRTFSLVDVDTGTPRTTDTDSRTKALLEHLAALGWEDDPAIENIPGYVYVRRDVQATVPLLERLERVERGDLEKLGKLDGRANAAVAVMEALERYNDETREQGLQDNRDCLAKISSLGQRDDRNSERIGRAEESMKALEKYITEYLNAPAVELPADKQPGEQTADAEVADPALLKTLVAQVDELTQKVEERGGVVAAMETAMPGTRWEVKIEGGKR